MSPPGVLQSDTKAAVLSAEGRGAIALVRVWGPEAIRIADAVFRPLRGRGLAEIPPGRLRVGRIGEGLGDEVVAVVLPGPVPQVEIECHGGPAAVAMVLDALLAEGAERAPAAEWVEQTERSVIAARAAIDLSRAPTVRTAAILLAQADGALEEELGRIARALPQDVPDALARLDALLGRWPVGSRLIAGWRVVLAGRPNVGKSHLLNALAGYERAIVDPTPGTTRDIVTVATAFDGWPVELADTAGLRASLDPIESQGVSLARNRHRAADLVLLVLDRSEPLTEDDRALLAEWPRALRIANKADLPASWCAAEQGALEVSATRGDGIEPLVATIARRLVPDPPGEGIGVPFRAEQAQALRQIRALLAEGAIDAALHALGRLL